MILKNIFKRKNKDQFVEVIELLQTINNRKLSHLNNCLEKICESAKVPYTPPASFVTEYELKVFERLRGERSEILKKLLLQSFNEAQ